MFQLDFNPSFHLGFVSGDLKEECCMFLKNMI